MSPTIAGSVAALAAFAASQAPAPHADRTAPTSERGTVVSASGITHRFLAFGRRTRIVEGDGVVGEQPLLAAGPLSQPVGLIHYLVVGAVLFTAGIACMMLKRNALGVLMGIELVLNGANINFVAFAEYLHDLGGQIFVFFTLTVAAATSGPMPSPGISVTACMVSPRP